MDGEDNITITYARGPFCKTKLEIVKLIYVYRSLWIDAQGSTSRAIYGDKQPKDFASHVCCKCKNWFRHFCLRKCDVKVCTHDFVCPTCQIPSTIPQAHSNYTNSCTSDKILAILLLRCHEIPTFIECIGNSPAEKALKAALCTMLDGDVHNGKTIMIDHIKSVLPHGRKKKTVLDQSILTSCRYLFMFGSFTLSVLGCNSSACKERSQTTYILQPEYPGNRGTDMFSVFVYGG